MPLPTEHVWDFKHLDKLKFEKLQVRGGAPGWSASVEILTFLVACGGMLFQPQHTVHNQKNPCFFYIFFCEKPL